VVFFLWPSDVWLTLWSSILLERLIVSRLLKKVAAFCGTGRFITVFKEPTSGSYVSQMYQVHTLPPYLRLTLILYFRVHIGLRPANGLFLTADRSVTNVRSPTQQMAEVLLDLRQMPS
jgi:hypothetical protein